MQLKNDYTVKEATLVATQFYLEEMGSELSIASFSNVCGLLFLSLKK